MKSTAETFELYKVMYTATEIPIEEDDQSLPGTLTREDMYGFYPPSASRPVSAIEDTPQYLLTRVIEEMLLDSQKTLDIHRQAAFTKRAATVALQTTDSGLTLAMLYVIYRMLKRYPKLRSMIEATASIATDLYKTSYVVSLIEL